MDLVEKIDKYLTERKIDWKIALESLSDKELFVIGVSLGFKSAARKGEIELKYDSLKDKYKVSANEYDQIKQDLIDKGIMTRTGALKNDKEIKEAWKKVVGVDYPSQLHQWAFK